MSNRVKSIVRRVSENPRIKPVLQQLTVPYAPTAAGTNLVVSEYYGLVVGRTFDDDAHAARHYFRTGWRSGVVPNPFIEAPAARFNLAAALLLRNSLAGAAMSSLARVPYRLSRAAPAGFDSGVVELTRSARRAPESTFVQVGNSAFTWHAYLERCRALHEATQQVVRDGLIDMDLYASQVGGARPISVLAALDDYLANGELDGRLPNPFFEAEWYHSFERGLIRRGRPINLFLDFVAHGQKSQASPHFWGHRYLQQHAGEGPDAPLARFLHSASAETATPSADGVVPVSRAEAEALVRSRVAEYHDHERAKSATGPVLARHHRASDDAVAEDCQVVVFVDERHLASVAAVDALRQVFDQRICDLRVVLIEQDDIARLPETSMLIAEVGALEDVARDAEGRTFGAVARRYVERLEPDGWLLWTPEQRWAPGFLGRGVAALRRYADAPVAAVVSDTVAQPWLRTEDALWTDVEDGVGVLFAGSGPRAVLPDAGSDLGLAWRELIRIVDAATPCAVIEAPLVRKVVSDDVDMFDARAGANVARSERLAPFDKTPSPGVAVAIPTFEDWRMTLTAVRQVLETTDEDTVVHVIDNGSRRPVASILDAAFAGIERVTVRRMARNTDFALGSNVAASDAARAVTVFLNNDTAAQPGWLAPLSDALEDSGIAAVQPLLLYGDRTVQTAGTIFMGGMSMPRHLLADVHPLDVDPSIDDYAFAALTGACFAVRYEQLRHTRGFDAHYVNGMEDVDLCMRLSELGTLNVRTASSVVHYESRTPGRHQHHFENRRRFARRWRARLVADLDDRAVLATGPVLIEDVRWSLPEGSPLWEPEIVYARRARSERVAVGESLARLRWAIKTSATGDISGDSWGDTFFAESLAQALRRQGQEVVIDRRTSHDRASSTAWDDVTLTLRGLERYLPQPDSINLLWIISHPDLVTRYELESGFQKIYAAGAPWARRTSEHWGVAVEPLLQATDALKFNPGAARDAARAGALFVGRTRGVARPIVLDSIAAGHAPEVYGDDGWEQFIDPALVKAPVLHNDAVPAAYAAARIVLNDHWADMAENGFFSNRLFDAAAVGARIVSDPVPGMDEVFGRQVRTYRSVDELRGLLAPDSPDWPDDAALAELASAVIRDHSFDARAATLVRDALDVRKGRAGR